MSRTAGLHRELVVLILTVVAAAVSMQMDKPGPSTVRSPVRASSAFTVDRVALRERASVVRQRLRAKWPYYKEGKYEVHYLIGGQHPVVWYGFSSEESAGEVAFTAERVHQIRGATLQADGRTVLSKGIDTEADAVAILGAPTRWSPETSRLYSGYWSDCKLSILFRSAEGLPRRSPSAPVYDIAIWHEDASAKR